MTAIISQILHIAIGLELFRMHVVYNVKKPVLDFTDRGQNINTPTPYSAVHVKNVVMKNSKGIYLQ